MPVHLEISSSVIIATRVKGFLIEQKRFHKLGFVLNGKLFDWLASALKIFVHFLDSTKSVLQDEWWHIWWR
jgi:hypothetical protein